MKILVGCLALTFSLVARADTFTSTRVCSQSNPTVGATTQCTSTEGASSSQSGLNATVGAGHFTGSATANAQAGKLGGSTSVTLSNYNAATNVFIPGNDDTPDLANAQAFWTDSLTINGLPSVYNLSLTFTLDGSASSNNPYFDSYLAFLTNLDFGNGTVTSADNNFEKSYYKNTLVPTTFTQTFTGLTQNVFQDNFELYLSTNIPYLNASQVPIYQNTYISGTGSADFSHTLSLGSLRFTDANGNLINNVSVSSAAGYVYNVESASPVPEPSTISLCLTGLAGAAIVLRKRFVKLEQRWAGGPHLFS